MNSITCHVCQTQNPSDNRFCTQCGTRVQGITHIICSVCYHRNALSLTFCDNCGSELQHARSTSDEVAVDFESEPTASDIKTGLLFASILEDEEPSEHDEDGDENPQVEEPVTQQPIPTRESELDIDWLNVLDIDNKPNEGSPRDASPPEITDWLAELSSLDESETADGEKSFTDELLMLDDPDWEEPLPANESSSVDDADETSFSTPEAEELQTLESDDSVLDVFAIESTDLVEPSTEGAGEEESTGLTDWLSEIEETAQDNVAVDEAAPEPASESEPLIDELPNWFSLADDSESASNTAVNSADQDVTDDWLLQAPDQDDLDTSQDGVTSWLNDLSEQTLEGDEDESWDNAELEEIEPATPKFPTWLLDDEDADSAEAQEEVKTGFTDWLAPLDEDDVGDAVDELEPEQSEDSWLMDDSDDLALSSDDDGEIADWLVDEADSDDIELVAVDLDNDESAQSGVLADLTLLQSDSLPDLQSETDSNDAFEWLTDDDEDPLNGLELLTTDDIDVDDADSDLPDESEVVDLELDQIEWLVETPEVEALNDFTSDSVIDSLHLDDTKSQSLFNDVEELLAGTENDDLDLLFRTDGDDELDEALADFDVNNDVAELLGGTESDDVDLLFNTDHDDELDELLADNDVGELLGETVSDEPDLLFGTDLDDELDGAFIDLETKLTHSNEDDASNADTDESLDVDDMSFDDWLTGEEDLLDESEDALAFPVDPDQSGDEDDEDTFAPVGTGFTSWLSSDSLPQVPEINEFSANDSEIEEPKLDLGKPSQNDGDGRTGFTGWLTAEDEAESEDALENDSSGAVIPDWLKDSDELPDLEETDVHDTPEVLGEGNGGQSFSDWLKDSGVEVEEVVEEESLLPDSEPTGFTQWLTDPTSEPLDLSVLEESGDDDWLENIIPDDDDSSDEVVADMPDWLTATPAVTSSLEAVEMVDDPQDEELPDWMLNMGTGDLDPTVLGDQFDELLESGDPEWIAELESGPLHSDRLPELDPSLYAELDESADESADSDGWSDTAENDELFDNLLHASEEDDGQSIDDDTWLASLNLDDTADEGDIDSIESDEIAVNAELPSWLMDAKPEDPTGGDDPDSFSFEAADGDLFAGTAEPEVNIDFLNKLSSFDEDDDRELDLSTVATDWSNEDDVVFDHQELSDDQLATADVPDWLQSEDDGLVKANVPEWLQSENADQVDVVEEEMFMAQGMDSNASATSLNSLTRAVPIAPALNQFITTQLQSSFTTDTVINERQTTKANSWADIVKHDVVSTASSAPKAPKVKAKRPPKVKKAQIIDEAQPNKRSRYRSLMLFLLLGVFIYFLWLFQPEAVSEILAHLETLLTSLNIDLSTIVP